MIRYQTSSTLLPPAFIPLARLTAFQRQVDRLFDLPFSRQTDAESWIPSVDLYQENDRLSVHAELPGLKKEDVTLSLHDGVLTIAGERKQEKASDEKSVVRNERSFGRFERRLTLPFAVDANRVEAAYQDGVLTVTLHKADEAKPRQIEIK